VTVPQIRQCIKERAGINPDWINVRTLNEAEFTDEQEAHGKDHTGSLLDDETLKDEPGAQALAGQNRIGSLLKELESRKFEFAQSSDAAGKTTNDTPIGNPPLNPVNNAFNGTNSLTNSNVLYNMDLDVYPIQNNIAIGDTTAQIQLTSSQDFVMINAIVTKLNSQLPDAIIAINRVEKQCDSRSITAHFKVSNPNSTAILASNTPISIYTNDIFLRRIYTQLDIPIDGNELGQVTLDIPNSIPNNFDLKFVVDDNGSGTGIVAEINEYNNKFLIPVVLSVAPLFNIVPKLESCNLGNSKGIFNFYDYEALVKTNSSDSVAFFESQENAENNINPILNSVNYIALNTAKTIYIRLDNGSGCYSITSFELTTKNCPPVINNFVSADNDGFNDTFHIEGLKDIFLNHKISIYNRWGKLIWSGNNNSNEWDGFANNGLLMDNNQLPSGTYYYIIELNDTNYTEPLTGYLYLTK
jgi:gliding motility-associated-like protein